MAKFAWVTLATNDSYSMGALVLAHSLRRVNTAHQLVVLITPGVTEAMKTQLSAVFNVVKLVDVLDSKDADNLSLLARPELGITFTKLHCWKLTEYEKCVFLDADTLVLQNSDELFEREELSAAPDAGWPDCFNSGVFVYTPSQQTFQALIEFALIHGSFDGGDQGLLNLFFSDWPTKDIKKHLPFVYNMCSTATYSYLPAFKQFGAGLKIIHFIGAAKPWLQPFNTETSLVSVSGESRHLVQFVQLWWDIFCAHVHPTLSTEMAGLAGALATVTLGAPLTVEQRALEEHLRRQGWEQGNIDYMGKDSFDNIWQKICQTLGTTAPTPSSEAPAPVAPVAAPVYVSSVEISPSGQIDKTPPQANYAPVSALVPTVEASDTKDATKAPQSETPTVASEPKPSVTEVVSTVSVTSSAATTPPQVASEAPASTAVAPAEKTETQPAPLTIPSAPKEATVTSPVPPPVTPTMVPVPTDVSTAITPASTAPASTTTTPTATTPATISPTPPTPVPTAPSQTEPLTPSTPAPTTPTLTPTAPTPTTPTPTPTTPIPTPTAPTPSTPTPTPTTPTPTPTTPATTTPTPTLPAQVEPLPLTNPAPTTPAPTPTTPTTTTPTPATIVPTTPAQTEPPAPTPSALTTPTPAPTTPAPTPSAPTTPTPAPTTPAPTPSAPTTPTPAPTTPAPTPTTPAISTPTPAVTIPAPEVPAPAPAEVPLPAVVKVPAPAIAEVSAPTPAEVPVPAPAVVPAPAPAKVPAPAPPTPTAQPQTPTVTEPTPPTSPPIATEAPQLAKLQVEPEVPATPPAGGSAQPSLEGAVAEEPPVPPKRKGGKGQQDSKNQKGGKPSKGKK